MYKRCKVKCTPIKVLQLLCLPMISYHNVFFIMNVLFLSLSLFLHEQREPPTTAEHQQRLCLLCSCLVWFTTGKPFIVYCVFCGPRNYTRYSLVDMHVHVHVHRTGWFKFLCRLKIINAQILSKKILVIHVVVKFGHILPPSPQTTELSPPPPNKRNYPPPPH